MPLSGLMRQRCAKLGDIRGHVWRMLWQLAIMVHTCYLSTRGGGRRIMSSKLSWLYKEFIASLEYTRPCLKGRWWQEDSYVGNGTCHQV